jgi:hypothetical protein
MKAIVSHDVDSITVMEHKNDLIVPKHLIRNVIELSLGHVSWRAFKKRIDNLLSNKWQCIDELMRCDRQNGVPSTFFVGVSKGCYLSYSIEHASYWIEELVGNGFEVGVHGIEYVNRDVMRNEYDSFKRISGINEFGVRMHYLRKADETLDHLASAGYLYDSTVRSLSNPYMKNGMWEFPLHIMDSDLFYEGKRWQRNGLSSVKEKFAEIVRRAHSINIEYLTILFHDQYFNDGYEQWAEWYHWTIDYLRNNNIEFIGYKDAVVELNGNAAD